MVVVVTAKNKKVAIVYTLTGCPYCTRVKKHLRQKKYRIIERRIGRTGTPLRMPNGRYAKTYPQVFIGGKLIGGCDATIQKIK